MAQIKPNQFLAIARIIRPQGRCGEVIAEQLTDFPERFGGLRNVYLEAAEQPPTSMLLQSAWQHKGRIVLKFAGIESIEAASRLRNRHVLIPFEERVPLPEDSYYWSELVGCRIVLSAHNRVAGVEEIGTITAVEPTGGVALLHVARDARGKGELLIPFARAICKHIDPAARRIEIDPPEDLLGLNDD